MKKIKISKLIYNKSYKANDNYFFVFTFFNMNSSVAEVLKMILEDNYNYIIPKIEIKSNLINFYLEINIEEYFTEKQELFEFFNQENFKFILSAINYKSNYIESSFFENEISSHFNFNENDDDDDENDDDENDNDNESENIDVFEFYTEILFINFIKIINSFVHFKNFFFLLNNVIFLNKTLFKYKCLQSIKQHLN